MSKPEAYFDNQEGQAFHPQQSLDNQPPSQPNFYDDTPTQNQQHTAPSKNHQIPAHQNPKQPINSSKPQENLNKDQDQQPKIKNSSFCGLFRFSTSGDVVMMVFAAFFSCAQGAMLPLMTIFFADFSDSLSDSIDPTVARAAISKIALKMLLLGVGVFVAATVAIILWSLTGRRQLERFRSQYFRAILFKSATWFDKEKPGRLANGFFEHIGALVQVYSSKMHLFYQIIAMVIAGFAVGFYKGWLMSLLILATSPIMVIGMMLFMYYVTKLEKSQTESYSRAGSISDQSFEFIRGVKSLNGQQHEVQKYQTALMKAHSLNKKHGWKGSFYYGLFNTSWTIIYALSFLIGNYALGKSWHNHNTGKIYTVGDYIGVFFGIITGISAIGMLAPVNKALASGQAAMGRVNQIVDGLNMESSGTQRPNKDNLKGQIVFENVTFAYPTAPDRPVLKNVNFTIRSGEKFAIVGPSGSGKSTVIQLIERFYDPQEGRILLDGTDIKEFEIEQYRKLLGLVSQQPILFADSIRQNLLIGLDNAPSFSDEQIWAALERANVKTFISQKLEKGLETYVGSSGGQLSGGQKQRISIARVLLRNPKLFLFDEATSALDRQNEKEIQETIDRVCTNVTSVSIAHRLQTIKNSHQILVLVDGALEELGTHEELMDIEEGVYRDLYTKQDKGGDESIQDEEELENAELENDDEMFNFNPELNKNDNQDQDQNQDQNQAGSRRRISSVKRKSSIRKSSKSLHGENLTDSMRNINEIKQHTGDTEEEDEEASKKKKKKIDKSFPTFVKLTNYLSGKDVCFIILGVISSGFVGAVMPFIGNLISLI